MSNLAVGEALTADLFGEAYACGFIRTVKFLQARCGGLQPDQAEEIAQAAWARGWECRKSLRDVALLATWINTIALNLFRSDCRVAWRREELAYHPAAVGPSLVGLQTEQTGAASLFEKGRATAAGALLAWILHGGTRPQRRS